MSDERRQWEETILGPALKRFPERRPDFQTSSGIPLERLYTPEDAPQDYEATSGYPGQYPYTRGVQPTMYRGRLWTMRQYAAMPRGRVECPLPLPARCGQTGLSVAFDLPTQIGYDADDPMALGEVGKVG
jgi:methylmalonyl-CoA mutase N-terminal domain/subunit